MIFGLRSVTEDYNLQSGDYRVEIVREQFSDPIFLLRPLLFLYSAFHFFLLNQSFPIQEFL